MQIWSNTNTLDAYLPDLSFTSDKAVAEIALIGGKQIHLSEFPRLKGLFKTGVGRDNVPEVEAALRGVTCAFPSAATAQIIYEETANFACYLILRCMFADVGSFVRWTKHDRHALSSRRLLVLGTGNIGNRVATKMAGFMHIDSFDTVANRPDELESKIRDADCVSLHVPLTDATRSLINREVLSWMKDGAALVNTARGPVVVEDDLLLELKSGRLRAAFDVFWSEPYSGRLLELPEERFIRTPHVASTCQEFLSATSTDFLQFVSAIKSVTG